METIERITQEIMADPANRSYTERGIPPLFSAPTTARINIVGQAPGVRAQETRLFWNDPSGDRLRAWMGVDRDTFYHSGMFAILPMDFYFPGKGKSGDLAPRRGFAEKWHPRILADLPDIQLTILVGQYATPLPAPQVVGQAHEHRRGLPQLPARVLPDCAPFATQRHLARCAPVVRTRCGARVAAARAQHPAVSGDGGVRTPCIRRSPIAGLAMLLIRCFCHCFRRFCHESSKKVTKTAKTVAGTAKTMALDVRSADHCIFAVGRKP